MTTILQNWLEKGPLKKNRSIGKFLWDLEENLDNGNSEKFIRIAKDGLLITVGAYLIITGTSEGLELLHQVEQNQNIELYFDVAQQLEIYLQTSPSTNPTTNLETVDNIAEYLDNLRPQEDLEILRQVTHGVSRSIERQILRSRSPASRGYPNWTLDIQNGKQYIRAIQQTAEMLYKTFKADNTVGVRELVDIGSKLITGTYFLSKQREKL